MFGKIKKKGYNIQCFTLDRKQKKKRGIKIDKIYG